MSVTGLKRDRCKASALRAPRMLLINTAALSTFLTFGTLQGLSSAATIAPGSCIVQTISQLPTASTGATVTNVTSPATAQSGICKPGSVNAVTWQEGPKNGQNLPIRATTPRVQRPDVTGSLMVATNRTSLQRFTLEPGWAWSGDAGRTTNQRSELSFPESLPTSGDVWVSMEFLVENGATATNWSILGQMHTTADGNEVNGPTVTQQLLPGDKFAIFTRGDANAISTTLPHQRAVFVYPKLERGVWHHLVERLTFSTTGGGHMQVWFDSQQVVNADEPVGYNNKVGCNYKYGIYRANSTDTLSVQYANVEAGTRDLSERVFSPLPVA